MSHVHLPPGPLKRSTSLHLLCPLQKVALEHTLDMTLSDELPTSGFPMLDLFTILPLGCHFRTFYNINPYARSYQRRHALQLGRRRCCGHGCALWVDGRQGILGTLRDRFLERDCERLFLFRSFPENTFLQ